MSSRVIIIGAGFGGLYAARTFANKAVDVLLVDRNNYHTFTPLLYQVATCGLDPSEIAYPIRSIFRDNANIHFLLGEVIDIDHTKRLVHIKTNEHQHSEPYDYLIIATGSVTSFYGMSSIEQYAFGLKTLKEAVLLRNHILKLFEKATWIEDVAQKQAMLTLVVVGGGPTGLETAGALYELYNHVLQREYASLKPIRARVILIEAAEELLLAFPENLRQSAFRQLKDLGVELMLGKSVVAASPTEVQLNDGQTIGTHTLIWAAGIKASPLATMLGVALQRGGRIPVQPTLEMVGNDAIYIVGDATYLEDKHGVAYPALIPVAKQQGILAAQNILHRQANQAQKFFTYRDRGIMATIGRNRAVAWIYNRVSLSGYIAWLSWLFLHLVTLMGFRNRLTVFVNWVWNYLTHDRSVRIILEPSLQQRKNKEDHES